MVYHCIIHRTGTQFNWKIQASCRVRDARRVMFGTLIETGTQNRGRSDVSRALALVPNGMFYKPQETILRSWMMRRLTGTSLTHSCIALLLLCVQAGAADDFEERRQRLLEVLTDPHMLDTSASDLRYAYRSRWQYYHACSARGIRIPEANRYFATSKEIVAEEWPVLMYLCTYHDKPRETLIEREVFP